MILAAIAVPNFIAMQARAKEAAVKSNCHTTQLAAEDFGQHRQPAPAVAGRSGHGQVAERVTDQWKREVMQVRYHNPADLARAADVVIDDLLELRGKVVAL